MITIRWCTRLLREVGDATCRWLCGERICFAGEEKARPTNSLEIEKRAGPRRRPAHGTRLRFSKLSKFLIAPTFLPGTVVLAFVPFLFLLAHPPAGLISVLKFLPLVLPISLSIHEFGHVLSARASGVKLTRKPVFTLIGIGLRIRGRPNANSLVKTYSGGPIGNLGLGVSAGLLASNPFFHALAVVSLFNFLINAFPGFYTDGGRLALLLMSGSKRFPYLYAFSLPISTALLVPLILLVF